MRSLFVCLLLVLAFCRFVPAQGVGAKLEGQIVCCEECWNRADRKTVAYGTPEDLVKAADCVANGDPTLLAVMGGAGKTTFYQLEEGKFKRPGKNWLELVGSRVAITGPSRARRGKQFVRVDELEVLARPEQIAPQPDFVGKEAELVLPDLFGAEQKLSALRGRVVILNFWATYCGPCVKEMPDLAAIQNQYAALGVQVVGATAETMAEQKLVRKFITDLKINFPIWLGATVADMARFGLGPALPGTAIIGRDGKIVAVYRGVISQADLKKQLDTLIAQAQREAKEQIAQSRAKVQDASSVPS